MLGTNIGNYAVTAAIGEGGMGSVYLAEHAILGRRAAVKVLRPELSTNSDIVARFFNEARALTAIRHPSIVEILDFGYMPDGSAYLVMEYLDGESLGARCHRLHKLDPRHALTLVRQIAGALSAAHERGVVHRDLKPENIFLVPDPEVAGGERIKVLDFGIAKLAEPGNHARTQTGSMLGTPTYMSPEQCRGAGSVDARADLYALGCVLFEMLCGQPPFTADGMGEVIAHHLYFPPPAPRTLTPTLSDSVEQLVLWLLQKDPAARPQTARDLVDAIDRLGGSVSATPPPAYAQPTRMMPPGTPAPPTPAPPVPSPAISAADMPTAATPGGVIPMPAMPAAVPPSGAMPGAAMPAPMTPSGAMSGAAMSARAVHGAATPAAAMHAAALSTPAMHGAATSAPAMHGAATSAPAMHGAATPAAAMHAAALSTPAMHGAATSAPAVPGPAMSAPALHGAAAPAAAMHAAGQRGGAATPAGAMPTIPRAGVATPAFPSRGSMPAPITTLSGAAGSSRHAMRSHGPRARPRWVVPLAAASLVALGAAIAIVVGRFERANRTHGTEAASSPSTVVAAPLDRAITPTPAPSGPSGIGAPIGTPVNPAESSPADSKPADSKPADAKLADLITSSKTVPTIGKVAIAIDSIPHGASVLVDGKTIGTTPFVESREPAAGRRIYTLQKSGYEPATVTLASDRAGSERVTLKRKNRPARGSADGVGDKGVNPFD